MIKGKDVGLSNASNCDDDIRQLYVGKELIAEIGFNFRRYIIADQIIEYSLSAGLKCHEASSSSEAPCYVAEIQSNVRATDYFHRSAIDKVQIAFFIQYHEFVSHIVVIHLLYLCLKI